jgi:hypothetical protein
VSNQILTVLSDQEQELLTGGADFSLNSSAFGNRRSGTLGESNSNLQGSTVKGGGLNNTTVTASTGAAGITTPVAPAVPAVPVITLPS